VRDECRVQSRGGGAIAPAGASAGQEAGGESREGLGAAGKFAVAEKSALWGNFHSAHKGRRVSVENNPPSRRGKSSVCMEALRPYRSRHATPTRELVSTSALQTPPQFTWRTVRTLPTNLSVSCQALGQVVRRLTVVK
jgi:hypothetical protein